MLGYYLRHSATEEFHSVSTPPKGEGWVHGEALNDSDIHSLVATYGLDEGILHDTLDKNELPRAELQDEDMYVFVRAARRGKRGQVITTPVLLAVKDATFFELSIASSSEHELLLPRVGRHANGGATGLLYASFVAIISEYEALIQRSDRFIKDTGHRLRTHEVTNDDFIKFVTVEDNLNEYRMNLNGMLVVAERLHDAAKTARNKDAVEDIVLYIRQLLVAIDSHSQSITSIRNAYGTIANNVLNQRMKTLTVLTLLVALPNVFYGMYGMNVTLPFQDAPWAYGAIVVFTFTLILAIYGLAKRLRLF